MKPASLRLPFTLLLALGCSSVDDGTIGSQAGEPEPGTVQQASSTIILPDGYGVTQKGAGGGNRCWQGISEGQQLKWVGGECDIPLRKDLNIVDNLDNCPATFRADYKAAFTAAANTIQALLTNDGWNVFINGPLTGRPPGDRIGTVHMRCDSNPFGDPAALASTVLSVMDARADCQKESAGTLCKYAFGNTHVFNTRIEHGQFLTTTQAKRRTFLQVVLEHEILHMAGLGHEICGPDPLTELMGVGGCLDTSNSSSWFVGRILPFEHSMLRGYNP